VASVVWLLAISEGISAAAQEQIKDLGVTNIILRSVFPDNDSAENNEFWIPYGITRSDYDALMQTIPTIDRALRIREVNREAYYRSHSLNARLVGCTPEYADMMHLEIDRGHFLTEMNLDNNDNVCVLGAGAVRKFFPLSDPVGEAIRIREMSYLVVGTMKPRLPMAGIAGSLSSTDFSDDVYIPITTFWRRIGDRTLIISAGQRSGQQIQISQITFQVKSAEDVVRTAKAIENTMERLHKERDFAVITPLELLEQARTTKIMFMVFMGLIAFISLVVGGIGIMNIMLATITERTREIGIRRALGAKQSDIVWHFLVEVTVMTTLGGMLGILGGLGCPFLVVQLRRFLETTSPAVMAGLPEVVQTANPVVLPWSIALAFGISVAIGIAAGLYPAIRAATMDPVVALRHE
jgi:putative ABC transport system permease protein